MNGHFTKDYTCIEIGTLKFSPSLVQELQISTTEGFNCTFIVLTKKKKKLMPSVGKDEE